MVWPSCDGLPSGPFRAPTPRREMVHPDNIQPWYQQALGSIKMSKYECQCVETSILQHVKLDAPGALWCSVICCDFESFRVPSEDEAELLSSKNLGLVSV